MADLQQMFDSMIGFLVGMTLMEVVIKPTLVRFGKKALSSLDDRVDVVPDWMHSDGEWE
jgi:hypothetical protein